MTLRKLHPFCNKCGWRKGGIDCWDKNRCKCGHWAPPLPDQPATVTDFQARRDAYLAAAKVRP